MKARTIAIRDDAQWRELRRTHIGGSECAALFGESSYLTHYELWHQKKGLLPERDFSSDDRVFFGRILEPAIIEGVRQKTNWKIQQCHRYYSMQPDLGLGGTLDAEIVGHDRGPGVLEIKTVDRLQAMQWDGVPPLSYELQTQVYVELTGRNWACIAVLVGGNELRLFTYERRPRAISLIKDKVREFWASIYANEPPAPDFFADHETVAYLYRATDAGKLIDLSDDERFAALVAEYETATGIRRRHEKQAKALRAEILMAIGDAETVLCRDWRLKAGSVAAVPERHITEDMVGQAVGGREGYRSLWVGKRKAERAA